MSGVVTAVSRGAAHTFTKPNQDSLQRLRLTSGPRRATPMIVPIFGLYGSFTTGAFARGPIPRRFDAARTRCDHADACGSLANRDTAR